MPPPNTPPLVHKISQHPPHNLTSQPHNVVTRIITSRLLALCIRTPRRINNVNQRISMPQVIKELVAQTASHVCTRYQPSDVKKLDRYRAPAGDAGAIVGFAFGF